MAAIKEFLPGRSVSVVPVSWMVEIPALIWCLLAAEN